MARSMLVISLALLAIVASEVQAVHYMNQDVETPAREFRKQLAGPPSEFANHLPPRPMSAAIQSDHALHRVSFAKAVESASGAVWTKKIDVDSDTATAFTIFAPESYNLKLTMTDPSGAEWTDADLSSVSADKVRKVSEKSFGIGADQFPSVTYWITKPATGVWTATLAIESKNMAMLKANKQGVNAFFMVFNETPDTAMSYLANYALHNNQKISLRGHMNSAAGAAAGIIKPLVDRVQEAEIFVEMPNGQVEKVQMYDDGQHDDLLAADGVYGGSFTPSTTGMYYATVEFRGVNSAGKPFFRTADHVVPVVDNHKMSLVAAKASYKSKTRLNIDIMTSTKKSMIEAQNGDNTFRAYAQVWGTKAGQYVPVAWVMSMADAEESGAITLELDTKWLTMAGASAPLELRQVQVTNRQYFIPVATAENLQVSSPALLETMLARAAPVTAITEEMKWGVSPFKASNVSKAAAAEGGRLILVHGYCAVENNFPVDQFPNNAVFEDFKASRPTDVFARMVMKFGDQFPSFGTLAHSHGGLATLHLHTYYFSNLEKSIGNRRLQSMGSPYQGVPIAGLLAALGGALGIGCGTASDLTEDGAQNWLSGIPMEARKAMYYYTTQYRTGALVNYCNLAANAVLKWPNDGVTEIKHDSLEGGNYVQNDEKWCHTVGMAWPQQCTDPTRNKAISDNANR